jgi:DNA-binding NarL/FixJ family response regulator
MDDRRREMASWREALGGELPPQLTALLDVLELMADQVRAYERILPHADRKARMAVAALGELARQALAEARDLGDSLVAHPRPARQPLSPREQEVLTLAAQGLTNREIAYRLGISDRTVQFHMNSVFNKTGACSRTEAAVLAIQRGWIDPTR